MKTLLLFLCLLALPVGASADILRGNQPPGPWEFAPYQPTVGWEYLATDEAILLQGGFRLYRSFGALCKQYFMDGNWDTVGVPIGESPATYREMIDLTIPDDYSGEVCYELTSFIREFNPDGTLLNFVESWRSERIGFHRLSKPSWWGDTVAVE